MCAVPFAYLYIYFYCDQVLLLIFMFFFNSCFLFLSKLSLFVLQVLFAVFACCNTEIFLSYGYEQELTSTVQIVHPTVLCIKYIFSVIFTGTLQYVKPYYCKNGPSNAPKNCLWITIKHQQKKKRRDTQTNRIVDWLLYQPEKYANSKMTTAVKKSFCGIVLNNKCTQVQMVPGKAKSGTGDIVKVQSNSSQ